MRVDILNGIYADAAPNWRTRYPRNLRPVPKAHGISEGYLRPADGIVAFGTGPGTDRGGINWNDLCYRVMGSKLVQVSAAGAVSTLADVSTGGTVTFDYGFDRLAIWSGGSLYYWDDAALAKVTDVDLGVVIDGCWIAGYFMSTDGTSLIVTELADPMSVNPLKYGSAESDPDPILKVRRLRNEAYAFGRYTIEAFQNIGGTGFPFQRIDGANVPRGIVGTHAVCEYLGTFAFVGSGRNEAPGVYLMTPGDTQPLSTAEIESVLSGYTADELSDIVVETRTDQAHRLLLVHLPDQTVVYDAAASAVLKEPVWFILTSSVAGNAAYRARGLVWCYGKWIVGDPTSSALGVLDDTLSSHFGNVNGWEFGTTVAYDESDDGIIHQLELIGLPGRNAFGSDPVIWTSYSHDGETWGQERSAKAGKQGDRTKRIVWLDQGPIGNWRIQKFRGNSDAHCTFSRLEARVESLFAQDIG